MVSFRRWKWSTWVPGLVLLASVYLLLLLLLPTPPTLLEAPGAAPSLGSFERLLCSSVAPDPPSCIGSKSLDHLVLVPGHAVLSLASKSHPSDHLSFTSDDAWFLHPYQRGQLHTLIAHIRQAVQIAAADPHALVVFSGGQTRMPAGPISEGLSYWLAANGMDWFDVPVSRFDPSVRAITEDYALDSLQNLLFSVCRFREYTQRYPSKITVVGFQFKKPRFTRLHRSALAFPLANFSYVGIDPSDDDDPDAAAKRNDGEQTRSFGPFSRDIYACRHPTLLEKKRVRNPFARAAPYYSKT
ncbi:MAG: hypothetical protein SGCHY_000610, partial [Lobulomycetales sp.]